MQLIISDTFQRADGAVGNNWTDANGGVWTISTNRLKGTPDGAANPYRRDFLLRPSGENHVGQQIDVYTNPSAGSQGLLNERFVPVLRYKDANNHYFFACSASTLYSPEGGMTCSLFRVSAGSVTL